MTAHSLLATDSSFAHVFAHGHPAKVLGEREYGEPHGNSPIPDAGNGVLKETHGRVTIFDFLARPENSVPRAAFAAGMFTLETMHGTQGSLDFPWERWDEVGAVFVDVSRGATRLLSFRGEGGLYLVHHLVYLFLVPLGGPMCRVCAMGF